MFQYIGFLVLVMAAEIVVAVFAILFRDEVCLAVQKNPTVSATVLHHLSLGFISKVYSFLLSFSKSPVHQLREFNFKPPSALLACN